jgi:hypothetical protein
MRTVRFFSIVMIFAFGTWVGCAQADKAKPATAGKPIKVTVQSNPTTDGGRGTPSLDDFFRPAAWIHVGGKDGAFSSEGGKPNLEWEIKAPVSASPTFRIEAFEPLLGNPKEFFCTLEAIKGSGTMAYAISSKKGKFSAGTEYSLLKPGDDFVIRNRATGDVVREIAPLSSGTFVIAAGIKNAKTGKEALAVTYFTVRDSDG